LKNILYFILFWTIAFLIAVVFIVPETRPYQEAMEKFEKVVAEKKLNIQHDTQEPLYRHGFGIGYMVAKHSSFIVKMLLFQTFIVALIFLIFKSIPKSKPKNVLLPDPFNSVKNIASNLILFTLGVFNRRASEQLSFYFDLPVRSRLTGLMAYVTIFIAITFSYATPRSSMFMRFTWISYFQVFIVILLLVLVFFIKPFRKNYQRRLFWLSLCGMAVMWSMSMYTGYQLGQTQPDVAPADLMDASYFEPRILVVNMLIVLAFSFYIEVMKQISTQKARLDAEMSMAQRIQNDLLPVLEIDSHTFSLYGQTESATEVGGDYCDVIRLSDNCTVVAVGDVSGHNVAAGLTMAMLKTAFRTELSYLTDVERMVASLNETVYDNVNRNMFISLLFGMIDPVKHELTLINCGHPPMLHYSAKDESIYRYRTGGPALGLQRKSDYQSEKVEYASGDIFVFLSDGLIETANVNGEELGCEQVSDLLRSNSDKSPVDLYNVLIENAKAFRDQLPQRDDVTIVVLKMN